MFHIMNIQYSILLSMHLQFYILEIFRTVKQAKCKEEKLIVFGKILKSSRRLHSTYLGVMSAKAALVAHVARLILALSA